MKFEIINPSDPYTVEADDLQVAAVACCFLGDGRYAFEPVDGGTERVPIFLIGGHDEWFTQKFGMTFEATADHCMQHRAGDLARVLESVTLGRAERSSLNDIGGRANALAQAIRRQAATPTDGGKRDAE